MMLGNRQFVGHSRNADLSDPHARAHHKAKRGQGHAKRAQQPQDVPVEVVEAGLLASLWNGFKRILGAKS